MKYTIYKYPLRGNLVGYIHTPENFTPLHAGYDKNGDICIWGKVGIGGDPAIPDPPEYVNVMRRYWAVPTGTLVPDPPMTYIGTAINNAHGLVFHVYLEVV